MRNRWLGSLFFTAILAASAHSQQIKGGQGADSVEVELLASNIVHVHVMPDGKATSRTLVLEPALASRVPTNFGRVLNQAGEASLQTSALTVRLLEKGDTLQLAGSDGHLLLTVPDLVSQARGRNLIIFHGEREVLYGMRGLDRMDSGAGITRSGGATVAAGIQGDGGAPFFFTTRYGVLIDSDGGAFEPRDERLRFRHNSRPDLEFFLIVGPPMQVMSGLADLTGYPPMPPRWTLGFLNSQWGSSEAEIRDLVAAYRQRKMPLTGFILDFDWKAWGEDDYGEFRWNSTSGTGNPFPNKFPNGASGKFAADLLAQGVHLAGILKPRLLVNRPDGKATVAAAYATQHTFWYPNEDRDTDYFTHRLAANLDFAKPEARAWFWQHLEPAFRSGMTAWWNDEADYSNKVVFNNFQFLNMGRALYEGQRASSNERVWSINRAYYLGAVRYGYAAWSGDIETGFQSMAYQRRRMIATLNLGESSWSMDTGGFDGHPTPENYARWMEFAAFTPIDRVHGNFNEKRQPWVYGPVAEAAANRALHLRASLLPYLYSNQRLATETGIGLVRPLFWAFPEDPAVASETRSWMFGDSLLVSPIVEHAATSHTLYLPSGTWFDYASGRQIVGGRELTVPVDSVTWQDIPLFVRAGSILATQEADSTRLTLDVFPSPVRSATFIIYEDDGHTYAYEHGVFRRQQITATAVAGGLSVEVQPATGSLPLPSASLLLRVHGAFSAVTRQGRQLPQVQTEQVLLGSASEGWSRSEDRFGALTMILLDQHNTAAGTRLDLR